MDRLGDRLEMPIASASATHSIDVGRQLDPLRAAVRGRIEIARDRLRRSQRFELQVSLFDNRAEQLAAARQHAFDCLDAALLRRALSLAPAPGLAMPPRLIAVWPLEK